MKESKRMLETRDRPARQIYIDGAGVGPDGTGSGYAWIEEYQGRGLVRRIDGLTNNEAEYAALRSALLNLPEGSTVEVFSDSQLVVNQFNHKWGVNEPRLARRLSRIQEIIRERDLKVRLTWVPREENPAEELL